MEKPYDQNPEGESGKRGSSRKYSLQEMIFTVIESECSSEEMKTWLSTQQWNHIFGIIEAAGISQKMNNKIISWFQQQIHRCRNYQVLYNQFAVDITGGQLGTRILQGAKYLPPGDEICLLFDKEDLLDYLQRNLTEIFPHQSMRIEDRFLLHNLVQAPWINPQTKNMAFEVFNPSFCYFASRALLRRPKSNPSPSLSFMDQFCDLGGDKLNTFLKTGRLGTSGKGLAVLAFDKQLLREEGTIFRVPTWVDKLTVCSPNPYQFNSLYKSLSEHRIGMGVIQGAKLKLEALTRVALFDVAPPS